jgi:hypothetical protein
LWRTIKKCSANRAIERFESIGVSNMATEVKILMLADADGSFVATKNRFALTELIAALEEDAGDEWKFVVTKAHRLPRAIFESANPGQQQGADPSRDNFIFDSRFNINAFDELWLFGFASANPDGPYHDPAGYALRPDELAIVEAFMEAGGGVFAVGDHDDLGRDLCGSIPRVRSMRRWEFDYKAALVDYSGYQEGSMDCPPVMGRYRHSTIVKDVDGHYEFDNQSDDIPQTIRPEMTVLGLTDSPYLRTFETFPHPLLCGPNGVIKSLPDHMHEGQCQVPDDLTATYGSGGTSKPEYPQLFGAPLAPQVVAWEDIVGRAAEPAFVDPAGARFDDNQELSPDTAGAMAAWDGHLVAQGRVVVDATFHHFVNVNVLGVGQDLKHNWAADEAIKNQGLKGSSDPRAQLAYRQIRQYWRNIAIWSAPQKVQTSHALGWIRFVVNDGRLRQFAGLAGTLDGMMQLGVFMKRFLGTFLAPCAVLTVSSVGVPDPWSILLGKWYIIKTLPDPPREGPAWKELPMTLSILSSLALGAAATTIMHLRANGSRHDDRDLLKAVHQTSERAIRELLSAQVKGLEDAVRNCRRWAGEMGAAELARASPRRGPS